MQRQSLKSGKNVLFPCPEILINLFILEFGGSTNVQSNGRFEQLGEWKRILY
jgi:hypothetical protein